jgi:hypothetical protein
MQSYVEYLWRFHSTYEDLSSIFNATPMNGAGFSSSTITGYGLSLFFIIGIESIGSYECTISEFIWSFVDI